MKALVAWFKAHPLYAVLLIVALVLLGFWFKDVLGSGIEKVNRWRFSKTVAEQQVDIDKLKKENAQLTEEMKKAYALGEAKELERDAAYAELERYGAAAKAAVEAQRKASVDYESEKTSIAVDVPMHDRCLSLCAGRAEAGYPCKPSGSAFCNRYAGR